MEMQITTKVNIKFLQVVAGVRYWEDATINGQEDTNGDLIPCRDGDYWKPRIDIETGQIVNWQQGRAANIHYKVCEDGEYLILDETGKEVKKIDGYVPRIMSPKSEGHGDYIIMDIDENGFIQDWKILLGEFEN